MLTFNREDVLNHKGFNADIAYLLRFFPNNKKGEVNLSEIIKASDVFTFYRDMKLLMQFSKSTELFNSLSIKIARLWIEIGGGQSWSPIVEEAEKVLSGFEGNTEKLGGMIYDARDFECAPPFIAACTAIDGPNLAYYALKMRNYQLNKFEALELEKQLKEFVIEFCDRGCSA